VPAAAARAGVPGVLGGFVHDFDLDGPEPFAQQSLDAARAVVRCHGSTLRKGRTCTSA
jgi:hypothetical protein